ncbi:MAG: hypothetical protein QOG99_2677, partial [Frankiales bacterium]|nr:hypothetical protein [Frankiales bacterium]
RPARRSMLPDGTVVLRPSRTAVLSAFYPLLVLTAPVLVILSTGRRNLDSGFLWAAFAPLALETVVLLAAALRRAVFLGSESVTLRGLWRSKTVAAADIQSVTVGGGSLSQPVLLWTADRRRHSCPAITEADLTVVGDWWLAHRGPDWRPAWTAPVAAPRRVAWWA